MNTKEGREQPLFQWGLQRDISPRFGARLVLERYRLYFLSDRASLVGEWSEDDTDALDKVFPHIIKKLEAALLAGEIDSTCHRCAIVEHDGFKCEADSLGSHGYIYIAIYRARCGRV